ncbi:LCP family protein [Lacticaseibacillus paracasei]|uniref:LCP family protein n=1 Tax=Lacticaseibacillus paracasei TaxID=1597 RepID=UPI00222F65A3|nr:LCP family protein [Lacticaseibacillus paracasei]UZD26737.1 LCP family protein [Lacticaseibacillus paracasei]
MLRSKKAIKLFTLILFLSIICIFSYGTYIYIQAKESFSQSYKPAKGSNNNIVNKKPFTILLLGIDTGSFGRIDKGNSDTMLIVAINPKEKKSNLVSIPRDTAAQIIGTKDFNMQKINAAYNIGGSSMATNTVANLLNIPVNYYLTINMGSLEKIVNSIGGIDITVPFSFQDPYTGDQKFTKGKTHMNGSISLAYVRMRHADPEGDYGRQKRQQQVIKAIVQKATSVESIGKLVPLVDSISKGMATNISFKDMETLFLNSKILSKNIATDHLQGTNAWIGDGAYQIASDQELQRVSNGLRKTLGLPKENLKNEEVYQNEQNKEFVFNANYDQNYTIFQH